MTYPADSRADLRANGLQPRLGVPILL